MRMLCPIHVSPFQLLSKFLLYCYPSCVALRLVVPLLGHVGLSIHKLFRSRRRLRKLVYVQPYVDQLHSAAADVAWAQSSLSAAFASKGNCSTFASRKLPI